MRINQLQSDLTSAQQRHQMELYELEEKLRQSQQKAIVEKDVMHKEEVSTLTREWDIERKVCHKGQGHKGQGHSRRRS